MQYPPVSTQPATPLAFAALHACFAALPDPRRAQGRRFPLAALLTLAVAAILANHLSVLAIAEWGAAQHDDIRRALGFSGDTMPYQTTLYRLFARLDAHLFAAMLAHTTTEACRGTTRQGPRGVAVDGKAHRGRLAGPTKEGTWSPIHMLAQMPVTVTGDKAAAELATVPALLARLDWQGRVLTGDALPCERSLCQQVVDAGGDYLVLVKANQPTLLHHIATLFAHRADRALNAASLSLLDMREAITEDRGHEREEQRTLVASTDLNDYLDWPAVAQVCTVERVWQERGMTRAAVK